MRVFDVYRHHTMKILGIDPGIATTGFGLITMSPGEERLLTCGVLRTPRNTPQPVRLAMLHDDLAELLAQHRDIALCGVEELFFAKNAKTAFTVGQARGVILFTLQHAGITIQEMKPSVVKYTVAGSGNADKKTLQKMMMLRFHLAAMPQPDDAADAIAIALAVGAQQLYEQL